MNAIPRREFLRGGAAAACAIVLAPLAACGENANAAATTGGETGPLDLPTSRPADWDAVAFNTARGNAGAIPASYLPSVNGSDGATAHVGKHLPFVPTPEGFDVPAGMLPLMWGDPSKGHAKHPNAVRNESNQMEGHWYDWIELRKATDATADVSRSLYPEWPGDTTAGFAVLGGGDIEADAGKNTVYLCRLPADVRPGDLVRVHAHCLTHGEYVDFVVVPG